MSGQGPEGVPPLVVKSVGEDADRTVAPVEVGVVVTGKVGAKVLSAGRADGEIVVTAINVGDATAQAEATPVKIRDRLPAGLHAVFAEGTSEFFNTEHGGLECAVTGSQEVQCTFGGTFEHKNEFKHEYEVRPKSLPPYEQLEVVIGVAVAPGTASGELNEASVSGGGAPGALVRHPIKVAETPGEVTPFGVEDYELTPEEVGGSVDAQAGSHPFQLTATLDLNETAKYPELIIVLTGEDGVTVQAHGETFISKQGITTATFATVPDVPFSSFELTLPEREDPALTGDGNLCKGTLIMPTEIVAQNGLVVKQSTKISVTGCPKGKKAAKKKAHHKAAKRKGKGKKKR